MDPQQLQRELSQDQTASLRRRRAIVAASLAGMASMSAVSLYQTGLIDHLPDLPLPGFDSDKVSASPAAFRRGVPDGTLAAMGCALNLPLAAFGGRARARDRPLIPLLAAAKGAFDVAIATRYIYEMATVRKAWCSYCLVGALVDFVVFGLTLPEARSAVSTLREP
jgi:uncharacterized membrane protein